MAIEANSGTLTRRGINAPGNKTVSNANTPIGAMETHGQMGWGGQHGKVGLFLNERRTGCISKLETSSISYSCPWFYYTMSVTSRRDCNFPTIFRDRAKAREMYFPDRESREIGKYLCTEAILKKTMGSNVRSARISCINFDFVAVSSEDQSVSRFKLT